MSTPPLKPDAQPLRRSRGVMRQWLGGPRLILDDRGEPREVTRYTGLDDDRDEAPERDALSTPDEPAPKLSPLEWLWLTVVASAIPLVAAVAFVLIAWRWAGSIANSLGLQGLSGRFAVAGCITMIGLAVYLIADRHKAHRSRRHTAIGERSKRDEHAIRWVVGFQGVCYCCAYHIAPLAREPDGCVVCPECGAAWRVDDWGEDGGRYDYPKPSGDKLPRPGGSGQSGWAEDARGVMVPVLGRSVTKGRRGEVARRAGRRFSDGWGTKIVLGITLLLLAASIAYPVVSGNGLAFLACVVFVPLALLVIWKSRYVALNDRAERLARSMTAAYRCPCCDVPLRDTPSPIDACLLCDACGSAWNPPAPRA